MHTKQLTLQNGLRVVLVDTKGFPSLTTILLVGVGSRFENEITSGISHFLEHMPFKGTKNYPSTEIISNLTDGMGGITNAFTSKDHTAYWIKAPAMHLEKSLSIISDLARHPLLDEAEIEREKGVIVEEINMYEDTPANKVEDLYEQLLFKGNPLGRDIIGTKETVTAFTKETFATHHEKHYFANNSVLVIAGGFDKTEEEYLDYVKKYLGDWETGEILLADKFHSKQSEAQMVNFEKKTEQAHLVFGYRSFGNSNPDKYILTVLSAILGGGMSSRLFLQVRERRGLCYYIHTSPSLYHEAGSMATSAGVPIDTDKIRQAISVIRDEHQKLTEKEISNQELRKVKDMIKGRSILAFEDSRAVAVSYGARLLLEGKIVTLDEYLEKIESVTAEQVLDLAKKIIIPSNENIALLAPKGV